MVLCNNQKKRLYKVIKCPLKSVLKEYTKLQPVINDVVKDINTFVIVGYQFIRLYLLNKFINNEPFPTINKTFILYVLITISKIDNNTVKCNKNKAVKDDLNLFYQNVFSTLLGPKLPYPHKRYILEQSSKEMLTCLKTNISTHFTKHLFKYINCLFKDPKSKEIKLEKDKQKRQFLYKELNKEIKDLKLDLINDKIDNSNEKYHDWIIKNKKYLYPAKITKSVAYDVKIHPEKYLIYSFYINSKIEELGKKPFQVIPQRNNIIPKNIVLNTSGIADYISKKYPTLFDHKKSEILRNCKKYQKHVWSKLLKLEKRSIFNHKDYVFYNEIKTDGFSCSLLFILKKHKDKKFGSKIPKIPGEKDIIQDIQTLTKAECSKYLTNEYLLVSLDPGKIRPISMVDENNNFYKYTACRRRFETYTTRSIKIINVEKKKHKIIEKEKELLKFNSKTLKIDEYQKFITNKSKLNNHVKIFYNNILFRKLKFRRFTKTEQSEELLLNEIENKFLMKKDKINSRKLLILYGDYSRTSQMRGTIPTPNIGFKKLLLKRFEMFEINEYNTSKLYNKTFKELKIVSIRKNKRKKLLYEILTPKEETERCIFVNRDKNACKNILFVGKEFLKNQRRPVEFCPKSK